MKQPRPHSTTRGFSRAAALMQPSIRGASESRGFSESRVLTHWAEIVGPEIAEICHPVDVSYSKGGFGATLSLLSSGSHAPILEMQRETIRAKVNGCYGYNAIARVRITQTAASGFAEGQLSFRHKKKSERTPDETCRKRAQDLAAAVKDDALRVALGALGANVMTKHNSKPE